MTHPLSSGASGAASVSADAGRDAGFGGRWAPLLFGAFAAGGAALALHGGVFEFAGFAVLGGAACGAGLTGALFLRRRANTALRAARAQAELAALRHALAVADEENAAKSRFLAEMSHELRTPLNAVIGFSEMMAHEVFGPHGVPAYGEYARDIHASGRHLLALADDILDLARIETGHRALLETAVSLPDLARDCTHMMRLSAAGRAVRLTCDARTEPLRLWADERALRQMTLNLLANAVKFTPKGGAVTVSVGLEEDGAPYLAVEDTGPGIGEAELPLDLSARHRESTLDPTTGRGAGLGLTIVRGLADLHGARVTLAARAEGGTRAAIHFPPSRRLDAAEADVAPAAPLSARV